ncbi:mavicyanin-like [Manihot esculenta]|uniref:Phytocyanin domain-containing protein n=1 Tax=Manihot esculenta TaxID=3983 RepID=A0A2C9WBA0_MANES|nr:mavicyanin-like [Manihot esculenta]OAY56287.1 hypothetical protein MANES_02G003900v8 [Manihot esculenta]
MANLRSPKVLVLYAFQLFVLVQIQVSCYQFKVGDLDAWGIPTSANPQVYSFWSKYHTFQIGDSLLFLYPPSQDSVIQVTEQNYISCNLTAPLLYMKNGNSLFNITTHGVFYFTSGIPGHCEKKQKLRISVLSGNGSAYSPSYGPSALPDSAAPSYPTVFGTMPLPPSSSPANRFSILLSAVIGAGISAVINAIV